MLKFPKNLKLSFYKSTLQTETNIQISTFLSFFSSKNIENQSFAFWHWLTHRSWKINLRYIRSLLKFEIWYEGMVWRDKERKNWNILIFEKTILTRMLCTHRFAWFFFWCHFAKSSFSNTNYGCTIKRGITVNKNRFNL